MSNGFRVRHADLCLFLSSVSFSPYLSPSNTTFEGTILSQIRQTISYLETQVREHSYLGNDGLFYTDRDNLQLVIQEMVVNSVCHRAYNIKGTEIQIKMFDDRIVFETPGDLPGLVRHDNIRHTHFSRIPKIAQYLKSYNIYP